MRRTKGFTLVELLVVIAIIALLMGILMPALARVRSIAFRMTCGTNLSGMGKAMLIYTNDYEEEFPLAGWPKTVLIDDLEGDNIQWYATTRAGAFGPEDDSSATITSCLYALVKYADMTTKSFVCKSETGIKEFTLAEHGSPVDGSGAPFELPDIWDFGESEDDFDMDQGADGHCSYAYHLGLDIKDGRNEFTLTTSSDPGMAVAADANPWFVHAGIDPKPFQGSMYEDGPYGSKGPFDPAKNSDSDHIKYGNSIAHQEEGQNVSYVDGHVSFEKVSFCGVEEDNIYTVFDGSDIRVGKLKERLGDGLMLPANRKDSFLIGNRQVTAEEM